MNEKITGTYTMGKSANGQTYQRISLEYPTHVVTLYDDLDAKTVDTQLFNQVVYEFWQQFQEHKTNSKLIIDHSGLWARYTIYDTEKIEKSIGQTVYIVNAGMSGKAFYEGEAIIADKSYGHGNWLVSFPEDYEGLTPEQYQYVTRHETNIFDTLAEAELAIAARNKS